MNASTGTDNPSIFLQTKDTSTSTESSIDNSNTTGEEHDSERSEYLNRPVWPPRRRSESYHQLDNFLKSIIRTIPDFPKPGLNHHDVTTLLLNPKGFQATIDAFARRYDKLNITHVVSCEARGFIFGAPLALALSCSFVPVRRARRLPADTVGIDYKSGFSTQRLEVHSDAIPAGSRVVIIDDMVATGNTLRATYDLMQKLEAVVVECGCIVNAKDTRNESQVQDLPFFSLLSY